MRTFIAKTLGGSGIVEVSDSPLGKGGEGAVYSLTSHQIASLPKASELVAKIYYEPNEGDRLNKIKTMVISPPETTSVAWPVGVLYEGAQFVGYLMTKLESSSYRQWAELSNTKDRRRTSPDFDIKYALVACRNLAAAIDSIHKAGHMVGDVNESNIFVKSDASVLIVDTDSAQIKSQNGTIFPCLVGKPEYTAPEISHGSLKNHERTPATDTFAFAVAVYQMITGGAHPTDGIYTGAGDPPATVDKNRTGTLPGLDYSLANFSPAPRIPSECIPTPIAAYLTKALNPQPSVRPELYQFIQILDKVLESLQQCKKIKTHWYDTRDGACVWCARGEKPDPWGPIKPKSNIASQTTLAPIAFSDGNNSAPVVRRVTPQVSTPHNNRQPYSSAQNAAYSQQAHQAAAQQAQAIAQAHQQARNAALNKGNVPPPPSSPSANFANTFGSGSGGAPLSAPPGYSSSSQPSGSSSYQSPSQNVPNKIKGKTVLAYKDGTYEVRPPLGQLLRHNPRLAIKSIKNELPQFAHAWWDIERPLVHMWALFVGLVIGLGVAVSWQWTLPLLIPSLEAQFPNVEIVGLIVILVSQAAMFTSAIAVLCLFVSAALDYRRGKRQNPDLSVFDRDAPVKTILRFIPVTIVYGPILIVLITLGFILAVLSMVLNVLTAGVRKKY